MFTVNDTEARQRRAREKARELRPAVIAHSATCYRVEGSGGNFYAVTVEGAVVACTSMAGQNDQSCYHAFAALRTRAARAGPHLRRRAARNSLAEYELGLLPEVNEYAT